MGDCERGARRGRLPHEWRTIKKHGAAHNRRHNELGYATDLAHPVDHPMEFKERIEELRWKTYSPPLAVDLLRKAVGVWGDPADRTAAQEWGVILQRITTRQMKEHAFFKAFDVPRWVWDDWIEDGGAWREEFAFDVEDIDFSRL